MRGEIETEAHDESEAATLRQCAFQENAADLGAANEQIVGPFETQLIG